MKRALRLLGPLCLSLSVLSSAAPARAAVRWRAVAAGPEARHSHAMAYVGDGRTLLFGGCVQGFCDWGDPPEKQLGDLWQLDGLAWTKLTPTGSAPVARWGHVLAPMARPTALLFGGGSSVPDHIGNLGDTWRWNGGAWLERPSPGPAPTTLRYAAAAFDVHRQVFVLHGGRDSSNNDSDQLWEYTTGWSPGAAGGPPGRMGAAMAYDQARRVMVLFGGQEQGSYLADTWLLDCADSFCQWYETNPAHRPLPRMFHAMAWDSDRQVVVLVGGRAHEGSGLYAVENDVWEWDGADWREVTGEPGQASLPALQNHAAAYDEANHRLVIVGGKSGGSGAPGNLVVVREQVPAADGGTPDAGSDAGAADGGSADAGRPDASEPRFDAGRADAGSPPDASIDEPDAGSPEADGGDEPAPEEEPRGREKEQPSRYGCASVPGGTVLVLALLFLALRARRRSGALLLLLVLASAPAAAAERPRLAFLGLSAAANVSAESARALSDFTQSELAALGAYEVMGLGEVADLIGLEKRKQLLGCEENADCIAEIGGALGVDRALTGSVARLGDSWILNLSLLDVRRARVIARTGRRVRSDLVDRVLDSVRPALEETVGADPATRTRGTFAVSLQGALDAAAPRAAGTLGVAALWEKRWFAGEAALLVRPLGVRAEAQLLPLGAGRFAPYLGAGLTALPDSLALRGVAGLRARIGEHLVLLANLAVERFVAVPEEFAPTALLLGAGAGWAF